MEARFRRPWMGVATLIALALCTPAAAQFGRGRDFTANSQNFIVFASSQQWANQVAEVAEQNRRDLAIHWLGQELPAWQERIPLHVVSAPNLGAGGETRFSLMGDRVGNWMMTVQGTPERILDSVLPHEITHTIFATHFAPLGKYVPRWADEGACTTVEHEAEKRKHREQLQVYLRTGRGLAFNKMFRLKDYPQDILPLYAQGHSAVQFLLDQGGPRKFITFIGLGMRTEKWEVALREFYAYESIGDFQTQWNKWLRDGSPQDLSAYAPGMQKHAPEASLVDNGQRASPAVQLASNSAPADDVSGRQSSDPAALGESVALGGQPIALNSGSRSSASESWYKRRLEEVQQGGGPTQATDLNAEPTSPVQPSTEIASSPAGGVYPLRTYDEANSGKSVSPQTIRPLGHDQATARPQPSQSPGVQVLDWGDSVPVPGIQQPAPPNKTGRTAGNQLVPIVR